MFRQIFSQTNIEEYIKFGFGSLITIVVAVSSIVVTSKFVGPLPISVAQTTTEKTSTFDITGTSEITAVPDQAEITIGITTNKPTVAAAQNEANTIITTVSQNIQNLGVSEEDIKTLNFSVNPSYNYEIQPPVIEGYSVSTSLKVSVKELTKINNVIDTATANGANQVNNIGFSLSSEKKQELKTQARKEAIEDAKASAKELANLADVRLGKILNVVEYTPNEYQPPVFYGRADVASLNEAAPTNVEPGSSIYSYEVILSYETL